MRKMRCGSPFGGLVLATVLLFLQTAAAAQELPDYTFLEVVDSSGKPVPDATVETLPVAWKYSLGTNNEGRVSFGFSDFKISKEGYFPFYNLALNRVKYRTEARVELFKIPQTRAARRALGNEQLKREFLWAAKSGDAETLKRLLKAGIDPKLKTGDLRGIPGPKNVSAFDFAVSSGSGETVEVLLKTGVDVRNKGEPFRYILVNYLFADPFRWRKPPDEAARREWLRRYEQGFESLVAAGADLSVKDYNKRSLLMQAALGGYARIVQFLLARGFSPNEASEYNETVLRLAAEGDWEGTYSKIEVVSALLKAGAKPNQPESPGCSPALATAAGRGDLEVIKILLEHGAKISGSCSDYALTSAVRRKRTAATRYLLDAGANFSVQSYTDPNALMIAAGQADTATVKLLLEKGFPVDGASEGYWTALFFAINEPMRPNLEVMRILLAAGADPNRTSGDTPKATDCYTPLILAGNNRHFDAMRLLIEYKADINRACGIGVSVLSREIMRGEIEQVKKVVELGADVKTEPVRQAMEFLKANRKGYIYPEKIDELINWLEAQRAKN